MVENDLKEQLSRIYSNFYMGMVQIDLFIKDHMEVVPEIISKQSSALDELSITNPAFMKEMEN